MFKFNVLSDNLKKEIKKEYSLRLWIVILVCVIFISVSFIVLLFPTWLSTSYHNTELETEVSSQQKLIASRNTQDVLNIIDATNEKLSVIHKNFEYSEIIPLINSIIGLKNTGIYINNFTFVTTGTSTANISLYGVSSTREALVSFVKRLQDTSIFSNVVLPVSNLTKDKNIDFSLTLTSTQ